jgi:hypothetical protein
MSTRSDLSNWEREFQRACQRVMDRERPVKFIAHDKHTLAKRRKRLENREQKATRREWLCEVTAHRRGTSL